MPTGALGQGVLTILSESSILNMFSLKSSKLAYKINHN